ncbi:MAG: proline dehydrogenase family protein, partial [Bacteroidota bacterium]
MSSPSNPSTRKIENQEISFEDTEVAFASKSNNDLRKAHMLFRLVSNRSMMVLGKHTSNWALKIGLPVKGLIKQTIFHQFCGGETIAECAQTTKVLDAYNIGTILDYSVEGKDSEVEFEAGFDEIFRTIETADNNPHIPFCVFKVSGLSENELLERISAKGELTKREENSYNRLKERVDKLCARAVQADTPIFFDAEESWIQDAID